MGLDASSDDEREVRAALNESLFRAVNEKLTGLNEAFVAASDTFVIACECADVTCVRTLDIQPDAYRAMRANPRQFAVLPGHVYTDVETVVSESDAYVIVEKTAAAAMVAEKLAP